MEVAPCLQKASRRGDTALAGYMAIEMSESGYATYCWKRLLIISAEDCAGLITQEIKALHDAWLLGPTMRHGVNANSRPRLCCEIRQWPVLPLAFVRLLP